ncbi:hypothetical protein BSY17_3219 (plasmid) [Sphingobium sp. RAC03]|nr:hypothetical protein BSY17_3219 [Sphingobium sp. RAC03]
MVEGVLFPHFTKVAHTRMALSKVALFQVKSVFGSASDAQSDVDRMSFNFQARLVECFAQRRMGMDDTGDILRNRAHLDRRGECSGQFGNMRNHGLNPDDTPIACPRNNPHKPAFVPRIHRQRAAAGGEGKDARDRMGRIGPSPTLKISGSVKQIAGISTGSKRRRLPEMISATISPCVAASVRLDGLVRQQPGNRKIMCPAG